MASITIVDDHHQESSKLDEYQSIFEHYGFKASLPFSDDALVKKEKNHFRHLYDTKREILEKNASNKKTINAKSAGKKSKSSPAKSSAVNSKKSKSSRNKTQAKERDGVIKIPVPEAGRARKATYSTQKGQQQQKKDPKVKSSVPKISVHAPSSSTVNTTKKLPDFDAKSTRSISSGRSSTGSKLVPGTPSGHSVSAGEPHSKPKQSNDFASVWNLEELNSFTREMFRVHTKVNVKSRPYRVRLNCPVHADDHLTKYVHSQTHCVDVFEEHVNALKRQHGLVQKAASDQPILEPGISITDPKVKTDASTIDKEDSRAIKKLARMEPRKKYALVHDTAGIFIIGGYNLHVDVPIQKEPETDYLLKFSGEVVNIPPLKPCRVHFGVYTDGKAIYVAGGQTIQNELLDDVQRLNMSTLKWQRVATLMNPIAACGMTLDDNRIYLVGGYDIVQNQTIFLNDYTVFNTVSRRFESATNLPSPRCRSLVFAIDHAIFCVSGLVETRDANDNKQLTISNDILKWTRETSQWMKVAETPTLTKLHALAFTDPYLEVTKRVLNEKNEPGDPIEEAYYDFKTNTWNKGKAPKSAAPSPGKPATGTSKSPGKTKKKLPVKTPSKTKPKVAKSPSNIKGKKPKAAKKSKKK